MTLLCRYLAFVSAVCVVTGLIFLILEFTTMPTHPSALLYVAIGFFICPFVFVPFCFVDACKNSEYKSVVYPMLQPV